MVPSLATLAALIVLGLWVAFFFESRNEMNRQEYLTPAFVFQWNVLPLMVALELLATQHLIVLALGVIVFFLSWPVARFLTLAAPVLVGWHVGITWFEHLRATRDDHVLLGGLIVAIVLALICQGVVAAVSARPRHA